MLSTLFLFSMCTMVGRGRPGLPFLVASSHWTTRPIRFYSLQEPVLKLHRPDLTILTETLALNIYLSVFCHCPHRGGGAVCHTCSLNKQKYLINPNRLLLHCLRELSIYPTKSHNLRQVHKMCYINVIFERFTK